MRYYGVDWIAMVLGLASAWLLRSKHRMAPVLAAASGLAWLVFGFLVSSFPNILMNVIFIGLQLDAFRTWTREAGDSEP